MALLGLVEDVGHFGDAAAHDIGCNAVCELPVDHMSKGPSGDGAVADADRHGDLVFDEGQDVVVFG